MADETPEWFWQLIKSSEHKLQRLAENLEALSKEQLIAFQFRYEEAKERVNPYYADELFEFIGDCSEDTADDFTDWVVSQGRIFFERVKNNPASAQECLKIFERCESGEELPLEASRELLPLRWDDRVEREEYRDWQSPGFIARGVYERRFGESLYELLAART